MSSQVLTQQASALDAWVRLLRGHSAAMKAINARLVEGHGLTINDYEVLLHLARAEGARMRRVDLAERILLTPSGVTRLLDGLERAGLVERASCESDRRVTYAVLTEAGQEKLEGAGESHVADVRAFFEEHFSKDELDQLASLLGRLPGVAEALGEHCTA